MESARTERIAVKYRNYQSIIEEIKDRCNIIDVVSAEVPLKRTGSNFKGLCPFHSEKTPSFVVSESRQRFTCFGCGASGDVIEFVKRYHGLSFPESVERLANLCGISMPDTYGTGNKKREGYYEINRQAARFFFRALAGQANPALTYMTRRGVSVPTLKEFGVGYADDQWDSLVSALEDQGFDQDMMLELGLVSKKNERVYDRFRSRVIFPILNLQGKVIGFGGRILGEGEPKYLNSQESIIFQKKYNLFGLNLARREIQREGYTILVEGYTDVISLYQHGVKHVAATLGTALTEQQARLLKRYADRVVLCYDSDSAGVRAALRGADVLRAEGLSVRVLNVPELKDPDAYVQQHGGEAFVSLIKRDALPDVDYKLRVYEQEFDLNDTAQHVRFLKKVTALLRTLPPVEADLYIDQVSARYRVSEGAIRREVQQGPGEERPQALTGVRSDASPKMEHVSESALLLERMLLRLIYARGEYLEGIRDYPEAISTPIGMRILSAFRDIYVPEAHWQPEEVLSLLDEEAAAYIEQILQDVYLGENDEEAFADCIAKLQEQRMEKRKEEILQLLSAAEESGNESQLDELMKEFILIQQSQQR